MKFFRKYSSINSDYLHSDKHIHSCWTDGDGSIWNIANQYKNIGVKQIAITDHIRKSSTYFDAYYNEIKKVGNELGNEILVGFEAKVMDFNGNIDVLSSVHKKADIQIVSVHRFPMGRKLFNPGDFSKRTCQEIELELSIAAINNGGFNVLGHPGGMSLRTFNEFPVAFFEEIISLCKKKDVAFDLNTNSHIPVLNDLIPLFIKHDPYISIGSDLHKMKDINKNIPILKKYILNE